MHQLGESSQPQSQTRRFVSFITIFWGGRAVQPRKETSRPFEFPPKKQNSAGHPSKQLLLAGPCATTRASESIACLHPGLEEIPLPGAALLWNEVSGTLARSSGREVGMNKGTHNFLQSILVGEPLPPKKGQRARLGDLA